MTPTGRTSIAAAAGAVGLATLALLAPLTVHALRPGAPQPRVWFGYNEDYLGDGDQSQDAMLHLTKVGGATTARFNVNWYAAEPQEGVLHLEPYDALYRKLIDAGIRPVIGITDAPCWARPTLTLVACDDPGDGLPATHATAAPDPSRLPAYAAFAAEVTRRYPRALAIELWNEPNTTEFWGGPADPTAYAQLVASGYQAVKSVDSVMPVLAGSVNMSALPRGGNMRWDDFLRAFYATPMPDGVPVRDRFDGLSVHPYPAPGAADVVASAIERLRASLAISRDAGDDAPPWVTEVGLTTNPAYDEPSGVPAGQQGPLLVEIEDAALSLGARAFIVHRLVDADPTTSTPWEGGIGVTAFRAQSLKPAYCRLAYRNGANPCGMTPQ
jgi:hypothetical protein